MRLCSHWRDRIAALAQSAGGAVTAVSFSVSPPVTPEDELWALTPFGGLSRRLTKVLPQTCRTTQVGSYLSGDDEEWELI